MRSRGVVALEAGAVAAFALCCGAILLRLKAVPFAWSLPAASLAGYRERALCRVMVAARSVCEDWTAGVDIDRSIAALHAETVPRDPFGVPFYNRTLHIGHGLRIASGFAEAPVLAVSGASGMRAIPKIVQ